MNLFFTRDLLVFSINLLSNSSFLFFLEVGGGTTAALRRKVALDGILLGTFERILEASLLGTLEGDLEAILDGTLDLIFEGVFRSQPRRNS